MNAKMLRTYDPYYPPNGIRFIGCLVYFGLWNSLCLCVCYGPGRHRQIYSIWKISLLQPNNSIAAYTHSRPSSSATDLLIRCASVLHWHPQLTELLVFFAINLLASFFLFTTIFTLNVTASALDKDAPTVRLHPPFWGLRFWFRVCFRLLIVLKHSSRIHRWIGLISSSKLGSAALLACELLVPFFISKTAK